MHIPASEKAAFRSVRAELIIEFCAGAHSAEGEQQPMVDLIRAIIKNPSLVGDTHRFFMRFNFLKGGLSILAVLQSRKSIVALQFLLSLVYASIQFCGRRLFGSDGAWLQERGNVGYFHTFFIGKRHREKT
jgi:hypothetical protein